MTTIITREVGATAKGSPLTNAEVDNNFTNLNADKLELGGTYSGGTANGVAYLNGSKVLTTGSALTFDGTNLSTTRLLVNRSSVDSNNFGIQNLGSSAYASGMQLAYAGVGAAAIWVPSGNSLAFGADVGSGTTEQMRLTSTGLGIGTSWPGTKLEVAKAGLTSVTDTTFGNVSIRDTSGVVNRFATLDFVASVVGDVPIARISSETASNGTYLSFGTSNNYGIGITNRALTIDPSGNLGLGVTPSAWGGSTAMQFPALMSVSSGYDYSSNFANNMYRSGAARYYIQSSIAATLYQQAAGAHSWHTAPSGTAGNAISFTQAMTLDASGNLGIGTGSPNAALEVSRNSNSEIYSKVINLNSGSSARTSLAIGNDASIGAFGLLLNSSANTSLAGANSMNVYLGLNAPMAFYTNAVERMRIDSSGNVGIGTSSPTWKLSVIGTGFFGKSSPGYEVDANDGVLVYAPAGSPAQIRTWVSGTSTGIFGGNGTDTKLYITNAYSGGGLSASTGMVIDASGNVGIGTSSPNSPLHVRRDQTAATYIMSDNAGAVNAATSSGFACAEGGVVSSFFRGLRDGSGEAQLYTVFGGALRFGTNNTERMRIDSSGNVGIGTSSPSVFGGYKTITVNGSTGGIVELASNGTVGGRIQCDTTYPGMALWALTNNPMTFGTNSLERMRIDSSGNLLVGTTSGVQGKVRILQTENATGIETYCDNASFAGSVYLAYALRNTTNGSFTVYNYYNVSAQTTRFSVYDSGNVANANNSYGAYSDIKLKENIVDASPKLEDLCKVRVRNYNFKNDQTHKQIGVIAQELEEVFPGMVEEIVDRDKEGNTLGTTTKQVKYSVFVPMLVKAIQELKAELDATKAEVAALKGN